MFLRCTRCEQTGTSKYVSSYYAIYSVLIRYSTHAGVSEVAALLRKIGLSKYQAVLEQAGKKNKKKKIKTEINSAAEADRARQVPGGVCAGRCLLRT